MIGLHLLVANWKRLGLYLGLAALGIYIVLLKTSLAAERRQTAKWQAQSVQRGQMLSAQNAAIAELHRASEQRRKAGAKARREARATGDKLQAFARRLEAARPAVGANCATPREVLGIEPHLSPESTSPASRRDVSPGNECGLLEASRTCSRMK